VWETPIGGEHAEKGCPAETLAALNGRLPREKVNAFIGLPPSEKAAEMFHCALRGLVDAWIQSGWHDGGDCPRERIIPRPAQGVLVGYSKRNAVRWDYSAPDGELRVYATLRNRAGDQAKAALDTAAVLFIRLLGWRGRARLARCDDCGTYFLRKRMPKKETPIYRGSFCPVHKGKGSAKRTEKSRENKKDQRIKRAADFWLKWKPARRNGERSVWVARQMEAGITGKWVTQNRKAIEELLERRKNHA
jgi:hypothetical protein